MSERNRLSRLGRSALALSILFAAASLHGCEKPVETNHPASRPSAGDASPARAAEEHAMKVVPDIETRLRAFAPTRIGASEALLKPELRPVLKKLVQAGQVMGEIFQLQVWPGGPAFRKRLAAAAAADPAARAALSYYDIMAGPWDRRHHFQPFVGAMVRPKGAGFYPEDMTKQELQAYLKTHPKDREAFTGYFTILRRGADHALTAVPYNQAYQPQLQRAAKLLREAAAASRDAHLKSYLIARADAFSSNDYRPSDLAWMDLGNGDIEVVIGPYEVYEDTLFGYKASFSTFVTLRDPVYSARLAKIVPHIGALQASLPMRPEDKKTSRGKHVPISVVVELFTGGDARAGVQTLAFNLPNDEVVRKQKGYKLVLLQNVAEAKFRKILLPIAKKMIVTEQIPLVTFDAFFTNTLTHETAHGLGPAFIRVRRGGRLVKTDVNRALRDLYSTIEEAKADIVGLFCAPILIQKRALPASLSKQVYASYLAGFFRSVRFGAAEAHGRANLISFNYLIEKGGIVLDPRQNKYRVDYARIQKAVADLAHDLLELEARGDYDKAKAFIDRYGNMTPEMKAALGRLTDVPVDIRPEYTILDQMKTW